MITTITIDNQIKILSPGLPEPVLNFLKDRLIFTNPQWLDNKKRGFSNYRTPKMLEFLQNEGDSLIMPRGFIGLLCYILKENSVKYQIEDKTRTMQTVNFSFKGELHAFQIKAIKNILSRRYGVLESPTASGKTIMALKVITERKQPAIVIVHTKELMNQWSERIKQFLNIPKYEMGFIGDGQCTVGRKITIAIINSLFKNVDDIKDQIGFLIVDECHRTPARTFTSAVSAFDCKFMLGLSATPYRRDLLTKVIHFHLGKKVHKIDTRELQELNKIMKATLRIRKTSFKYNYEDDYSKMITALTNDQKRNNFIASDVINQATQDNGISLVISDRIEHCENLHKLISARGIKTRTLTGSLSAVERKKIVNELIRGGIKVLIATAQLIGEGFDLKTLSSIFLTTPVTFDGRVKQYVGRVLRTAKGKSKAVIYDYVDKPGILMSSFRSRRQAYKSLGITV